MSGIPDPKLAGLVRPDGRYIKQDKILCYNGCPEKIFFISQYENVATK